MMIPVFLAAMLGSITQVAAVCAAGEDKCETRCVVISADGKDVKVLAVPADGKDVKVLGAPAGQAGVYRLESSGGNVVIAAPPGDNLSAKPFIMYAPGQQAVTVQPHGAMVWTNDEEPKAKAKARVEVRSRSRDGRSEAGDQEGDPEDDGKKRRMTPLRQFAAQPPELPSVWIGVHTSPVPKSLAAHVGERGVLIVNVAKESPADEAGLDRYDVVTAFDGKEIGNAGDLVEAIKATGAGKQAKVEIIRGGKEKSVTITPDDRPDGEVEYKYDAEELTDAVQFRGGMLQPGPGGQWTFQDLGKLKDLPDPLKNFQWQMPDVDHIYRDALKGFQWTPHGGNDVFMFRTDPDDENTKLEIKISRTDDGKTIVIHRTDDGKITVERVEDGNTERKVYDSAEELENDDEEAYKIYRGSQGGGNTFFRVQPGRGELPQLQQRWQNQVERQLRRSKERSENIRERARQRARQADRDSDDASESASDEEFEIVTVVIDKDGQITIKTEKDGKQEEHRFKSRAQLRRENPELHRAYRAWTQGE